MTKKSEIASKGEPDDPKDVSVYDFLYHDGRRIGSYLAQFDKSGHLQQVTQADIRGKTRSRGFSGTTGANIAIVQGEAAIERSVAKETGQSSERVYDLFLD